ncbi:plastid ribosomal protein S13 [Haematococcus lacustris]
MQGAMHRNLNARAFTAARTLPAVRPLTVVATRRSPLLVQNLRVNNVEIPNSKRIQYSLQYIFGIGDTSAQLILKNSGVENKKTYELNEEEINKIREEVQKYTTEADLRRLIAQNIKRLKDIGSYRGRRHIMGLPVRGQRTKTNARTRKGKVKTVAGKKKATK